MPITLSRVGSLVRQLRKEKNLTQVQLAYELGVSPASVYRYESGARPDSNVLAKLRLFARKVGADRIANELDAIGKEIVADEITRLEAVAAIPVGSDPASIGNLLLDISLSLSSHQRSLLFGFIAFLILNTDSTSEKMIEFLLEDWVQRAKRDLHWSWTDSTLKKVAEELDK